MLSEISDDPHAFVRDSSGVWRSRADLGHREEEYVEQRLDVLARIQRDHFWYRGRHRFLFHAVNMAIKRGGSAGRLNAIDLGGGCGGWMGYLIERAPQWLATAAVADSSLLALAHARRQWPAAECYQIDLMRLPWHDKWDIVYMLDVVEHLPDDAAALRQAAQALRPNGLMFITVPALRAFWSWNDEAARHVRRYSRADFAALASAIGLQLVDSRYFMFFLSPLLWLARWRRPPLERMSAAEIESMIARMHGVPPRPINAALAAMFGAETPLGHRVRFPFGTSLLAVLRKPA